MKIGITGGQGFIGSWIRRELLSRGHEVVVFDRHLHESGLAPGEEFFLGDVRDETAVVELAAHVEGIIHLAAVLGTQETIGNPRPSADTNIRGSLNVFEAANQYNLPVVYAGVGNHWMRNEGTGSYTISKTAAEDYARMFNAYRGGKISIVRPVNAYGPGQSVAAPYGTSKVRKIMPAFICRALTDTAIEIYGDGTQVSDCIYVGDVARVFVGAMEHTAKYGATAKPVEVGPADSHTVFQVAEFVAFEAALLTGIDPKFPTHLPMRPGEIPNATVSADTSTLLQLGPEYGADTFVGLRDGIRETVEYFATHWLPGHLENLAREQEAGE